MATFFDEVLSAVQRYVDLEHGGNIAAATESLGMSGDTLYKWLKKKRSPKLEAIGPIMDRLGFVLVQVGSLKPSEKRSCEQCAQLEEEAKALRAQLEFAARLLKPDQSKAFCSSTSQSQPPTTSTSGASGKPEQLLSSLEDVDQKVS